MFDQDFDFRQVWLEEARHEVLEENPLRGYCERVVIVRTSCRRRKKHKRAGTRRKYRNHEVELLRFLPSRRCVQVKEDHAPGMDALANEVFAGRYISPDENVVDVFLHYFRKL